MKHFILIYSFIILIIFPTETSAEDQNISKLQTDGNIVFIRHSLAPGIGDPENIDLNDCNTQRNLSKKGIEQSKNIGVFFKKNNISIDLVLSSEWCRCKDTAKYAFDEYKTFKALNSFYDEKFYKFKAKQINELKKFIKNWNGNKNLVLVTHYVVILEILGHSSSSGEIIFSTKNFDVLKSFKTN